MSEGLRSFFTPKINKRDRSNASSGSSDKPQGKKQCQQEKKDSLDEVRMDLEHAFSDEEMESMWKSFEEKIDQNLKSFKQELTDTFKNMISAVQDKVSDIEKRLVKCELEVKEIKGKGMVCNCAETTASLKKEINNAAQHSRKDNIRIFGMPLANGEKCKDAVCKFFRHQLGTSISPDELVAAHTLPSRNTDKPPPIIVHFRIREHKVAVLKVRKKLKGKGVSIAEDMTSDNVKLLNRASNSGVFDSTWFANGKVRAKTKKGKRVDLVLFEDFSKFRNM